MFRRRGARRRERVSRQSAAAAEAEVVKEGKAEAERHRGSTNKGLGIPPC